MNNVVEFILRMKDMMSQPMGRAASNAELALNRAGGAGDRFNHRVQRSNAEAVRSVAVLERAMRRLEYRRSIAIDTSQIQRANQGIHRLKEELHRLKNLGLPGTTPSGGGGGGNMLGSVVGGNLISGGISKGLSYVKEFVGSSLGAAMDYGRSVKSFEVLTGNAARGRDLALELRQLKENTIVGAGVYKNAQTMLGFGISENEIVKRARQIGDIGMGDQQRMESLTLAYSQSQAAGRLMGQDLLQFINAGFNPLQTMSDNWEQFGFKAKQSIGQLKEQMEKGAISSAMVAKAFDLATEKGGKFHNMMDAIGETTGGQFLKLKGQWAAFQIDVGNALMPIASDFMKLGSDVLHFLNISKTVPDALRAEHLEAQVLVNSIADLNEGNIIRAKLLDALVAKYPDFFGDIDKEKIKNEELLGVLDKVNLAYKQRIAIADSEFKAAVQEDSANELLSLANKARMQAADDKLTGKAGFKYLSLYDQIKIGFFMGEDFIHPQDDGDWSKAAKRMEDKAKSLLTSAAKDMLDAETKRLIAEAHNDNPFLQTGKYAPGYKGTATSIAGSGSVGSLSSPGVTHSGPKTITVNVNKEMIGELSINSYNIKEGVGEMEDLVREVFLRTINSLESQN